MKRITMSDFSHNGRLGNMMFQLASMIGISKTYGLNLCMPENKEFSEAFSGYDSYV